MYCPYYSTLRLCISFQGQLALGNGLGRNVPLQTSGYGGQKLFQRASMEESIPIKNDLVKSAFSHRAIGPNLLFEINSQTEAEGLRHQFTPPSDRKSVKTIRPKSALMTLPLRQACKNLSAFKNTRKNLRVARSWFDVLF